MQRKLSLSLFLQYEVYLLVRLLDAAINFVSEKNAAAFARFLGRVLFVLLKDRRDAAVENLTIAFGDERSPKWIRRTALRSFEHVGMLAAEFLRIRRWPQHQMADKIHFRGALSQKLAMMPGNHGILLLNSHFGCFEVSAATTKFLGFRLNLVQTGVRNPFLDTYFFSRGGEGTGLTTFGHKGIVKEMIARLQRGEMVACLADQRGDAERGVFVEYFGHQAPANEAFARIAIEGNAHVLPLCTYRLDDGHYCSEFGDLIELKLTGDRRTDLLHVSQQFHDRFEQWLRIRPEQGFWLQRKWRRKRSKRWLRKKRSSKYPENTQP